MYMYLYKYTHVYIYVFGDGWFEERHVQCTGIRTAHTETGTAPRQAPISRQ